MDEISTHSPVFQFPSNESMQATKKVIVPLLPISLLLIITFTEERCTQKNLADHIRLSMSFDEPRNAAVKRINR